MNVANSVFNIFIPSEMVVLDDVINKTDVREEIMLSTNLDLSNNTVVEYLETYIEEEYQRRVALQETLKIKLEKVMISP